MARISLDELRTRASTVDRAKLDATTEADIKAQRAADGDADLDVPNAVEVVEPPRALRVRLGLTQTEIADALKIPVGTWRNWEQGRTKLEPAAVSLLRLVSLMPGQALAALAPATTDQETRATRAEVGAAFGRMLAPSGRTEGFCPSFPSQGASPERVLLSRIFDSPEGAGSAERKKVG